MSTLLRRAIPLLLLALGVAGFLLLAATRPEPAALQVDERIWRVTAETVTPTSRVPVLTLYGHVESPRAATLRAAIEADVVEVTIAEGRRVAASELLVRLDDRVLQLQVQQREAELAEIRAQIDSELRRNAYDQEALQNERTLLQLTEQALARNRDLVARNLGSQAALDDARRTYEQQVLALSNRRLALEDFDARLDQLEARARRAEAVLESARLDRERTRIDAPFAGRIARLSVAPGDRVRVGDTMLELYDTATLEVRAPIPAAYLPQVRAALRDGNGLLAQGEIDGLNVDLRLTRLAARAPTTGAGVEGLFEVTSGGEDLPLGRFLTVRLSLPVQDWVIALPFEALYGTDRIYRLEEGRMRALSVERRGEWLAPDGSTRLLVHSPELRAGDRVVTTRLPNALDGLRVSAVDD